MFDLIPNLGGWTPLLICAVLYVLYYGFRFVENSLLRWDIGRSHKRHMARLKRDNALIIMGEDRD